MTGRMRCRPGLLVVACLGLAGEAVAQDAGVSVEAAAVKPAMLRAGQVARMFSAEPSGFEVFSPEFRAQVPDASLASLFTGYHAEHGPVVTVEELGPFAGGTMFRFHFESGDAAIMQIAVEAVEPHRIAGALLGPPFTPGDGDGRAAGTVSEASYDTDAREPSVQLRLPFDGTWTVFWGGRSVSENYHRATRAQRYAYDFVVTRDGSSHADEGSTNEDYYCFGQPILAPAGGVVVRARDGIEDNVPGQMNPAEILGNYALIDHGTEEFSLLAHLRRGSVVVSDGDRVEAGAEIGACGNSGNSSEPHLHYQLQDGPDFGPATSVPAPFHGYRAGDQAVPVGEPRRGQQVTHGG